MPFLAKLKMSQVSSPPWRFLAIVDDDFHNQQFWPSVERFPGLTYPLSFCLSTWQQNPMLLPDVLRGIVSDELMLSIIQRLAAHFPQDADASSAREVKGGSDEARSCVLF